MSLLWKIPAHIAINALALYLIAIYIAGSNISSEPRNLLLGAIGLTLINFLIKPIVKIVLSPIILLTLGLALIAINGLMLYILTIFVPAVTIATIQPLALVYAAILITGINIVARIIL